jgi:hypothetical protein
VLEGEVEGLPLGVEDADVVGLAVGELVAVVVAVAERIGRLGTE